MSLREYDTDQRNIDLLRTYHRIRQHILDVAPDADEKAILEIAYQAPAPRYYVSFEIAKRYVSQIAKGENLHHGARMLTSDVALIDNRENQFHLDFKPNKMALYYDLYRELCRRTGSTRIVNYAPLHDILLSPAPSFYLSRMSFKNIIAQAEAEKRRLNTLSLKKKASIYGKEEIFGH